MWRRTKPLSSFLLLQRQFSSSSSSPSPLYSFLDPTIFSLKKRTFPPPPPTTQPTQTPLTQPHITSLLTTLHNCLLSNETDQAWKAFKTLTTSPSFHLSNSKHLINSLITHLCSSPKNDATLNLKRAFACAVYFIEKNPAVLEFQTVRALLGSMKDANLAAPAFALVKCMLKYRYFMPFPLWGEFLVEITRKNCGKVGSFMKVFEESCRVALEEKLEFMKPDLDACNVALEACCRERESVADAENVVEKMSVLGIRPDEVSFGLLAYLYAFKGIRHKVVELKNLVNCFGFSNRKFFYSSLVGGYVKSGDVGSASEIMLSTLRDGDGEDLKFGQEIYCNVVKGFLKDGSVKGLANLIIEASKLELETIEADESIGFGIVNACVSLGLLDKAHSIVDEINVQGGSVGIGVYVPILNAYCKEHRMVEATQLAMEISNSGLQLDAKSYDALIEASMMSQDFHSAFTLFREMREAGVADLKGSYLTIMTVLMENQRPELMAAFLDEVVEDPRVEVKTHDWNSILHAFCKAGRLEDAKRTFRRMTFLQFDPNDQTYLSLINGYVTAGKYFNVLMLWNEVKRKVSTDKEKGLKFDHSLVDAFLYALVKGGFFDAVMQVVEKSQEMKIFVDKWRYKQAFMETHKKLRVSKLRRRSTHKMEALIAFKNWAGLSG